MNNIKLLIFWLIIIWGTASSFFSMTVKAESFEFSPASATLPVDCEKEVDVMIDSGTQHSNAADIEIYYDTTKITIIDSLPGQSGIQVMPGNAYDAYVFNSVDTVNGVIRVAAGALNGDLVGRKTFIKIKFKAKPAVTNASFSIFFTGALNTLDSNIAEKVTNLDILTFVTNGNYSFNNTACHPDIIAPDININEPNTTFYSGLLHIEGELTDDNSGVDISTFQLIVNGLAYDASNVTIIQTGNKFHYYITLDPSFNVNGGLATQLTFFVKDYAGNVGTASMLLNPQYSPTPTPYIFSCPTVTPIIINTDNTICDLPETGTNTNQTDNSILCQNLIEKEKTQQSLFNVTSVDIFLNNFAKLNNSTPYIGLLSIISLVLSVQTAFLIAFLAWALIKWGKKLTKYQGIIFSKDNNKEIVNAKVKLYDLEGNNLGETASDLHGCYFFNVEMGNYLVKIKSRNYKELETKINITNDGKINYHILEFKNRTSQINELGSRLNMIFIRDNLAFALTAYLLSMFALILNPNPFTLTILIINLVLLIVSLILKIWTSIKLGI